MYPINSKIEGLILLLHFWMHIQSMKVLILIRHAHALPGHIARVNSDALRPLSEEGRQKAKQTASLLTQKNVRPEIVLSSPLLRAVQTAEIIAQTWRLPVQQSSELNGLYSDEEVVAFLRAQLENYDTLAAVTHNPSITYVNQLLCKQLKFFAPGSFSILQMEKDCSARLQMLFY